MYPCIVLSSIFLSHPSVTALVFTSLDEEFVVSPTFPTLTLPSLQNNQSSLDLFGILLKLIDWGTKSASCASFGFEKLNLIPCVFKFSPDSYPLIQLSLLYIGVDTCWTIFFGAFVCVSINAFTSSSSRGFEFLYPDVKLSVVESLIPA